MKVLVPFVFLVIAATAIAETITIRKTDTTSLELPKRFEEAVARLAKGAKEPHEIIFQGDFVVTSTLKLQWWGDQRLTVSGPALLDGSSMPKDTETVFMAGRNLTLKKLRFVKSQGHAVIVGGGSEGYAIRDCNFEDCQQSAIHVWNDPHTIQVKRRQRGIITGNRVTRFNLVKAKWSNDGITVFDQGVTISRNLISDSATETNGIRAMGRDLVIERNVIKQVSKDDAGGIYLWGGPHASLFRGNIVRWNHVIGASRGIYLDDGTSGVRVEENVVEESTVCAIFISGGRSNLIKRNVVDGAPVFLHIDSRCLGWDSRPDYAKIAAESVKSLREKLAKEPEAAVLRERYSELRQLTEESLEDMKYGRPESNVVQGNFVRGTVKVWELMDFSAKVKTDFDALNKLSAPSSIEETEDLAGVSLRERFGFREWDRLEDVWKD